MRETDKSKARVSPLGGRSPNAPTLIPAPTSSGEAPPASSRATTTDSAQPLHPRASGAPRLTALLVLLAGLAFALPELVPFASHPQLPLLAAGGALLLAGLLISRPLLVPFLASPIGFSQVLVVVVLGAIAHGLGQAHVSADLVPVLLVFAVLGAGFMTPANPLTPFSAAAAALLGSASGSGWQAPSPTLAAALFTGACLLSYAATRTLRTQRAYAAARISLEEDIQRLKQEARTLEPSGVARAVLATVSGFASAAEPDDILQRIVRGTTDPLNAVGGLLLVWDDTQHTLRVGAIAGPTVPATTDLRRMEISAGSVPTLREQPPGQIVTVDANAFREPLLRSLLERWKVATMVGIRLERQGELLGLMFVGRARPADALTSREYDVLSGIAVHAVAALAHANLIADLRNAHQLKEEFMATMSHELRTPLNVIIGYTDLQIDGAFGDLAADHLDAVERTREQALQLLELIQATLDMGRLERGLTSIDLRDVSIPHFLEQLQVQIPPSWRKPTVEVNWQAVAGLPPIRTDPHKLGVILRNLIHNALKFTSHGLVNVTVSARPSRDQITFVVQDSGSGIRAEYLSQIFEMFRQVPQPDTVPGGIGLGLYIVRRFAHVLGAEIEVSSAPGRGTTFRVHLPVAGPFAALQRPRTAEPESA